MYQPVTYPPWRFTPITEAEECPQDPLSLSQLRLSSEGSHKQTVTVTYHSFKPRQLMRKHRVCERPEALQKVATQHIWRAQMCSEMKKSPSLQNLDVSAQCTYIFTTTHTAKSKGNLCRIPLQGRESCRPPADLSQHLSHATGSIRVLTPSPYSCHAERGQG